MDALSFAGSGEFMRCSKCGADNRETARFCDNCSAALSPDAPPIVESRASVTGERRHLTVLFCDLVGSTEIASRLDPEEWREIVDSYHRAATEAVTRFGGYVAQYLGDGVMAYFGWPQAHDDDVERAVRAGLAMLVAISKLNGDSLHPNLTARIGIDSGVVVIGPGTGKGADVFGDTPNVAARVQSAAEPGTVLVTDATHRLISGLFVVEDRGVHDLKGIAQPAQLYRVVRPSGMRGRLGAAAASRGLTPFIGREEELRLLTDRWERAIEGQGQVVLIVGEPGIGKSRLVQRFREQIAAHPHTWLESAAVPFFQNTPFYPVAEMLRQSFHWESSDTGEEKLAALEAALSLAGIKLNEAVPPLAELLELPVDGKYPASSLSPDQQRKRLLAILLAWVSGIAKSQRLVITTEDLHWADPSTLELIQLLVAQGRDERLLLLYTARPEFHVQWPTRAHHTQVVLKRLGVGNVREMITQVAGRKALAPDTVDAVIERTSGVPLFVEELTRALIERGNAGLSEHEIPVTLHDSLMARLDRLGGAKQVLQMGAVIGSEFSYELIRAIYPGEEQQLQQALQSLAGAELLYARGIAPDAIYQFKHALIRDIAHEALLRSRRRELHRLIAQTMTERFPMLEESQPEVLARHWAEAGEREEAVRYLKLSADSAAAHGGLVEAVRQYETALSLIGALPQTPGRDQRELPIQTGLGIALWAVKGWSHRDTEQAFTRAHELAERLGEVQQLTEVLFGLSTSALNGGQVGQSQQLADRMLSAAERSHDLGLLSAAHYRQGSTLMWHGEFARSREHLNLAISYCNEKDHRRLAAEIRIYASAALTIVLPRLGFAHQARELVHSALSRVERSTNSYHKAFTRMCACICYAILREPHLLLEHAEELRRLADVTPFFAGLAELHMGRALLMMGKPEDGIARVRSAIAFNHEAGFRLMRPAEIIAEAQFYAVEGRLDAALAKAADALNEADQVSSYKPEILTLKGDLLIAKGDAMSEAESAYEHAIQIACLHEARLDELQAETHLARCLKSQGRKSEAVRSLSKIYDCFTEGFDTADLKEAKALLDELNC
jgi:predicted ATPase/class 3 adenylate cyclase